VKHDDAGREEGVIGSLSLLQNVTLASQPISSMDWSPDKVVYWGSPFCTTPVMGDVFSSSLTNQWDTLVSWLSISKQKNYIQSF